MKIPIRRCGSGIEPIGVEVVAGDDWRPIINRLNAVICKSILSDCGRQRTISGIPRLAQPDSYQTNDGQDAHCHDRERNHYFDQRKSSIIFHGLSSVFSATIARLQRIMRRSREPESTQSMLPVETGASVQSAFVPRYRSFCPLVPFVGHRFLRALANRLARRASSAVEKFLDFPAASFPRLLASLFMRENVAHNRLSVNAYFRHAGLPEMAGRGAI
jgi:hypothetical protein